jgi:hypothetical protein
MTKLLETAFQKLSSELNESEQDLLAKVLSEQDVHIFLATAVGFLNDYDPETQQAIKAAAERTQVNHYQSVDDLFAKLGL